MTNNAKVMSRKTGYESLLQMIMSDSWDKAEMDVT